MGLSEIDLKVLQFACLNGVQMPEAEIAKQLRLKASTVSYSLNKMERERAIIGYRYRVDYARLGLLTTAWVLLKVNLSSDNSFEMVDKLLRHPQVHVASIVTGESDLAIKVIERDLFYIDEFVRKISKEFSGLVESTEVYLVTKNYKTHNLASNSGGCYCSFDETDLKILDMRMRFPGKEISKIASELGLHRNTVSSRWKTLWKEGVLVKKTPVVSPKHYEKLKMSMKSLVMIDASPDISEQLAKKLVKMEEVHELNRLLGRFSLMVMVRTAGMVKFLDFIKWILFNSKAGQVRKTVSILVLHSKPHKPDYFPQLLEQGIIKFRNGKLYCPAGKCR